MYYSVKMNKEIDNFIKTYLPIIGSSYVKAKSGDLLITNIEKNITQCEELQQRCFDYMGQLNYFDEEHSVRYNKLYQIELLISRTI